MAAPLGRRIAWAVLLPAAAALAAVDLLAVHAARAAERAQVLRRLHAAAGVVSGERRFFLSAPLDAVETRRRLSLIAGFEFVLSVEGNAAGSASSLPPDAAAEAVAAAKGSPPGSDLEVVAGGACYLAVAQDLGARSLLLLFPTAAVDQAGREAALPVLVASLLGLAAAGAAALLLGARIAGPIRSLAGAAGRIAREGTAAPAVPEGEGPPEVREVAAGLNRMVEALRRAEEERVREARLAVLGEFAAGIAHEVRNPLSSMRMTIQLLREDAAGRAAEDLDTLLDEVRRLEQSVEELLLFAGEPRLERGAVDLLALGGECARVLRRQAEHLGVAVRVEREEGAPAASGDAARLRTCVSNLLLNAVQASPRGGTVRVSVRRGPAPGRVLLEVSDAGPGIPPGAGDRVYEPFYSGRPGGTGLGLAVTRRIVEAHGGSIAYASGAAGTTFRVELPAAG